MALDDTDRPEQGSISIRLPDAPGGGIEIDKFLSYEYDENFLTPADAGSFSVVGDQLTDGERDALVPRARVVVSIDGQPQSSQLITKVRARSSRQAGTIITVETKDWLSAAVDSHVDPQVRFTASMTLEDLLQAVFAPFGMQVLATDNAANRNAITGGVHGTKTSKKGKPLKSYVLHLEKPYPNEGAFAFASRVSQRFGLWLWPAVDGKTVICGKPDFDQDARYLLRHTLDQTQDRNNVLESDVCNDGEEQPSCILASGFGAGGEFSKSTLRAGIINPVVDADITAVLNAYPTVKFIAPPLAAAAVVPIKEPNARPLFLYDPESKTQEQLQAFLQRELSLRMRKSLVAHYTILGHKLGGLPVAVDTIVHVQDDRAVPQLSMPMWVLGRRFMKSRAAGTVSTLELIRPGTLQF